MTSAYSKFLSHLKNLCLRFPLKQKVTMNETVALGDNIIVDTKKRSHLGDHSEGGKKLCLENVEKIKRKKVAMLLAYSGQGYYGMQRNPETKTIEEDLLSAMLKAGFITDEAFTTAQSIQFQRAARTDKGVSASRQIVSLKLPEDANVVDINKHLPEQIRTLAIKRTTNGFNCKISCDARTYSYMLPTFAFTPAEETISTKYRITPEVVELVKSTLKLFEGTHNFHNFTSKKKPGDPSANRYIMSFTCGDPFLLKDFEFLVIKVKGQSFMLHQIRKMIGLTIAVVRGLATNETVAKAWTVDRLDIPVAPGLGLVLDEVHYDCYNKRYGSDGIHEALIWDAYEDDIKSFRDKYIFPTIVDTEIKEESMMSWLPTLPLHTYDVREHHLHNSTVPVLSDQAVDIVSTSDINSIITTNTPLQQEAKCDIINNSDTLGDSVNVIKQTE